MIFTGHYASPLGNILLTADETGLTGLWFEGQKYFAQGLPEERREAETPVLTQTKDWLDIYFSGEKPDFLPPLHPAGSQFRQDVWNLLLEIPYGETRTYGEISKKLAESEICPIPPPRRWAGPWGITRCRSSFHATGWWGPTAASPAMPEG